MSVFRSLSKKIVNNFQTQEFHTSILRKRTTHILCVFNRPTCRPTEHWANCSSSNSSSSLYSNQDLPIDFNFDVDACPQGVQGDVCSSENNITGTDCPVFKQWLENCRRYGLSNCKEHLQGIQLMEKTEQENLMFEMLQKYEVSQLGHASSIQGVQECISAFPAINSPCPQGVQGDDCIQFKLWLENCYKYGYQDCLDQYQTFKAGRKTLNQIFAEQEKDIRDAAIMYSRLRQQHGRRNYSTSTSSTTLTSTSNSSKHSVVSTFATSTAPKDQPNESPDKQAEEEEKVPLSQKDKLKRAVKEYGSTVIVFHVSISLMSLGFFYLLVSSGVDIVGLLRSAGIGESILQSKLTAGTGTFVVAYAVHKVFAPVRIATTLTATPLIVRYLRKIGFLKVKVPPSTKP